MAFVPNDAHPIRVLIPANDPQFTACIDRNA